MSDERRLTPYVDPRLSEARVAEQWKSIEARLEAPGSSVASGRWVRGALAAAVVVGLAVFAVSHLRRAQAPSAWDGAVLDSGTAKVSVSLADGSRIELEPESRILVSEGNVRGVKLDMPAGGAHFDVPHVEGRAFEVTAEGVRVKVVGTKFSVTRVDVPGGHRVTVSVDRGAVIAETEAGGESASVRAGDTWSVFRPSQAAPKPATVSSAPSAVHAEETPALPVAETAPAPHAVTHTGSEDSAQELFEKGNAARQAGDARRAAGYYESLLKLHSTDGRAGLAALELGRLKMDQLGDPRGAVSALSRAIQLAPGAGFREDALARLVQAHGMLGNTGRCDTARQEYLASYPAGVHVAAVRASCGHAP